MYFVKENKTQKVKVDNGEAVKEVRDFGSPWRLICGGLGVPWPLQDQHKWAH